MSDAPPINRNASLANLSDALRALADARASLSKNLQLTEYAHRDEVLLSAQETEEAARMRLSAAFETAINATPGRSPLRPALLVERAVVMFADAAAVRHLGKAYASLAKEDLAALDEWSTKAIYDLDNAEPTTPKGAPILPG